MRILLPAVLLIASVFSGMAQEYGSSDFKKKFNKADALVYDESFLEALPLLKDMYKYDTLNANLNHLLGVCYLRGKKNADKAIQFLERATRDVAPPDMYMESNWKERKAPGITYYYLGKAYHYKNRFDRAVTNYYNYRSFISLDDVERYNQVRQQIQYAENAMELVKNPVSVKVTNLGPEINTRFAEYCPVVSADGKVLIFTSRREGGTGGAVDEDGRYYEDIYVCQRQLNGKWSKPKGIGSNINSAGHEAAIGLSPDGQRLFIYKDDNNDGNIYQSLRTSDGWSKPEPLGSNINTNSWETHASITADQTLLVFSSNRSDGGNGGRDIWFSKRLPNNEWGLAQNMGSVINTDFEEDSPFISPDGKTLIFSSMGHTSMGGFDIFRSEFVDGAWTSPENMGYPINTSEDDVFFVLTPDGRTAYYSSRMDGGYGDTDLYKLRLDKNRSDQMAVAKGIMKVPAMEYSSVKAKIEVTDELGIKVGTYRPNPSTGYYVLVLNPGETYNLSYQADGYSSIQSKLPVAIDESYQEYEGVIELEEVVFGEDILALQEETKALEEEKAQVEAAAEEESRLAAEIAAREKEREAARADSLAMADKLRIEREKAEALAAKEKEEAEKALAIEQEKAKQAELERKKKEALARYQSEQAAKAKALEAEQKAEEMSSEQEEVVMETTEDSSLVELVSPQEEAFNSVNSEETAEVTEKEADDTQSMIEDLAGISAEQEQQGQMEDPGLPSTEDSTLAAQELAAAKAAKEAEVELKRQQLQARINALKAKQQEQQQEAEEVKEVAVKKIETAQQEVTVDAEAIEAKRKAMLARIDELKKRKSQVEVKKQEDEVAVAVATEKEDAAKTKKTELEKKAGETKEEIVQLEQELQKVEEQVKIAEGEVLAAQQEVKQAEEKLAADIEEENRIAEETRLQKQAAQEAQKQLEELKELERKRLEAERIAAEELEKEQREEAERTKRELIQLEALAEQQAQVTAALELEEKKRKEIEAAESESYTQEEILSNATTLDQLRKLNEQLIKDNLDLKKQLIDLNAKLDLILKRLDYQPDIEKVELPASSTLKTLQSGNRLILRNIFFDYNQATLRSRSRHELNKLYDFMKKNPSVQIEVSGHTDSRGNDDYNLRLSRDRAQSVVNYLVRNGIASSRLSAVGYGETRPIARNENKDLTDNPVGRQLNRRIEIRIPEGKIKGVEIEQIEVPEGSRID